VRTRGNRIDEAEEEETERWGRAVSAGRPRRGRVDVPEASAMVGGFAEEERRGQTERNREEEKKSAV
jgi:hypothetical protein